MESRSINKYVIQELVEKMLGQLCIYYVPSKSNKKMVQKFFESFPFFFFDIHCQNILYDIMKRYQVSNHIDKNEDMCSFCYMIYEDISKKLEIPYKNFEDFIHETKFELYSDTIKMKKMKKNINHTYFFIITLLIISVAYVYIKNK